MSYPKTQKEITDEVRADVNAALTKKGVDTIASGSAFDVLLESIAKQLLDVAAYAEEQAASAGGGGE
jgi:predicted phage gp36 major capsid-like protein